MPSLTLSDRLIWFAHCPKAGGTSVERMLVDGPGEVGHLHWGWDLWWRRGGWRRADPPNSPQHLIWEDALGVLPAAPDTVFALVRDPALRMVSEYRWQRHGRRGTGIGRMLALLPFALWLRVMLAIVSRHPYAFDNHLRPQSDFIPEGARVFRLEDGLEPVATWLEAETGAAPQVVPHMLRTTGTAAAPLSRACRARIALAHAEDYHRFGYALPETVARQAPDALERLAGLLAGPLVALDRRGRL